VGTGLTCFFQHRNRERRATALLLELRQSERGRQAGRPTADNQDIDFEGVTRHR
jgi:hypothetical protein